MLTTSLLNLFVLAVVAVFSYYKQSYLSFGFIEVVKKS